MQIKVLNNQSLFDISIKVTGTANNAIGIAKANNIATSEQLIEGKVITIPDDIIKDDVIRSYYAKYKIEPATAITADNLDMIKGLEGINYWAIGINFKVS